MICFILWQIDIHETLIEKLDDEELEGSGFQFQNIEEAVTEIYRVNDIKASSYIELPDNYKNNKSIIKIQNKDNFGFLWCILAHLHPAEINKHRVSNYIPYINTKDISDLNFPMRVNDIPKFEKKNNLNINVFELTKEFKPYSYKNYNEKQIHLLFKENHYCLITKVTYIN